MIEEFEDAIKVAEFVWGLSCSYHKALIDTFESAQRLGIPLESDIKSMKEAHEISKEAYENEINYLKGVLESEKSI